MSRLPFPAKVEFDCSVNLELLAPAVTKAYGPGDVLLPASQISVTFIRNYVSVAGFTFTWQRVVITNASGIAQVEFDMESGPGQLIDDVLITP